eukprot:5312887-Pyramimonas_sp.AAC.1
MVSGGRTKTGQMDDAVDAGARGREWVRDVAAALTDSAARLTIPPRLKFGSLHFEREGVQGEPETIE